MGKIAKSIQSEYNSKMEWNPELFANSKDIFIKTEMPIFLSMALQDSETIDDLFFYVKSIRDKALPIRNLIAELSGSSVAQTKKSAANDIKRLTYAIFDAKPNETTTKFSLSVGLPFSLGLKVDKSIDNKSLHVRFIRDIYDNYSIPYTLSDDIKRVFKLPQIQTQAERKLEEGLLKDNLLDTAAKRVLENMRQAELSTGK
jgi:hypothetical protein